MNPFSETELYYADVFRSLSKAQRDSLESILKTKTLTPKTRAKLAGLRSLGVYEGLTHNAARERVRLGQPLSKKLLDTYPEEILKNYGIQKAQVFTDIDAADDGFTGGETPDWRINWFFSISNTYVNARMRKHFRHTSQRILELLLPEYEIRVAVKMVREPRKPNFTMVHVICEVFNEMKFDESLKNVASHDEPHEEEHGWENRYSWMEEVDRLPKHFRPF